MKKRPQVKICGINDATFAAAAERLGADYLGLIFAAGSPRRITVEQAKAIVAGLCGRARVVGVFTDASAAECRAVAEAVGFRIVQLHRRATAEDVDALHAAGLEVWTLAGGAPGDAVLFDRSHGDGEAALRPVGTARTVLAGGISAANVAAALRSGADVIDASGSLETAPGTKSIAKLTEFMNQVAAYRAPYA